MSKVKVYVADKINSTGPPHLIADGVDLTATAGITYYEDEIGWYYWQGELECSAD